MEQNQVISFVRDPNKKCCATCRHGHLVSYSPHDPLLAECQNKPQPENSAFPFVVMIANCQVCKGHQWREGAVEIEYRQKKLHTA